MHTYLLILQVEDLVEILAAERELLEHALLLVGSVLCTPALSATVMPECTTNIRGALAPHQQRSTTCMPDRKTRKRALICRSLSSSSPASHRSLFSLPMLRAERAHPHNGCTAAHAPPGRCAADAAGLHPQLGHAAPQNGPEPQTNRHGDVKDTQRESSCSTSVQSLFRVPC